MALEEEVKYAPMQKQYVEASSKQYFFGGNLATYSVSPSYEVKR